MAYGTQPTLPVIGREQIHQNKVRYEIFMLNDSGVGKVYTRQDGGAFTLIGGSYSVTEWAGFVQSNNRVYIFNGVDKLSYFNLQTSAIVTYTALTTPGTPTPTKTGLTGTTWTYYYKISANNAVGTSTASSAGSVTVGKQEITGTLPQIL